ncbi:hypothetical protein GCK72_025773 [Caenorhabditis remanei]|uniref:Uncharacterized protein n=1 Tax=Caenorhabditis remanei TaxID=31234 RepID=E3ME41_CAERE|nr:hypothetical protein GCK72_025773 [Caenorhabditis remanei]EFO99460.1 hypothetical protein CRE_22325 [Caenorhabditis remanei]KAF1749306.1 hypothetical protein GCK72_025773 [Caenorhabditis remanei]
MEWAMMYSGRPDRPKRVDESTSTAEKEMQQAMDFVNNNADVPLEDLALQNQELQKEKWIEYRKLKARKCPTLEEQKRGENGRIIFSDEYIDFIFYRELQPLVDIRVLQHTENIIKERIAIRDAKKFAEDNGLVFDEAAVIKTHRENVEPSTSTPTA